jgi:methyl-accepting chemotaxis protein
VLSAGKRSVTIVTRISHEYRASALILAAETLEPSDHGSRAYDILAGNPHLPGVAVRADEAILGYVDRASLLGRFSRPLMRDLYEKRPLTLIMDPTPLIVEEDTTIKRLAERITKEKPEALTAGFIISRQHRYAGIGTAIDLMRLSVEESERRSDELTIAHRQLRERKAALNTLADSFEVTLEDIVRMVGSAAIEMQIAAQVLSAISEVGLQVAQSSQMSRKAVEDMRSTNATVARLDNVAVKIGDIVEIIRGVAEQTNLLSLNATIESARTGQLGRGFGVVANEVKALATQTAKATGEISQHLAAIQNFTGEAVASIQSIGRTIEAVDAISSSITMLVERQAVATREIIANGRETKRLARMHLSEQTEARPASNEIQIAATEVFGSASRLMEQSKRFEFELRTFLATFREM